jgi:hypothetical protein
VRPALGNLDGFILRTNVYYHTRFKAFWKIRVNIHYDFTLDAMGLSELTNNQEFRLARG